MHLDPMMPTIVGAAFAILVIGLALRKLGQPQVVAYLLAGVVLGPHGLELFVDQAAIARVGDVGVILLLFFLGMEVSLDDLIRGWRVAVGGTALQIAGSVGLAWGIGAWLDWPAARVVLLGFVISLSSTAVVVSVLRARGELDGDVGRDALSILLVQDVALAPMLIGVGLLSGATFDAGQVALQVTGGVLIAALVIVLVRRRSVPLPFGALLRADHELQVFAAFLLCLGLALATGAMGLSSALGAFVAGLMVSAAPGTDWVHRTLEPFRVLLVALFFVSVGLLVDLDFVLDNWRVIGLLVVAALVTNTTVNAVILRTLGRSWRHSFYVGAVLAQIGEFSFVLAAIGRSADVITQYGYQLVIATIALTLLLSPAWIGVWHTGQRRMPLGGHG